MDSTEEADWTCCAATPGIMKYYKKIIRNTIDHNGWGFVHYQALSRLMGNSPLGGKPPVVARDQRGESGQTSDLPLTIS